MHRYIVLCLWLHCQMSHPTTDLCRQIPHQGELLPIKCSPNARGQSGRVGLKKLLFSLNFPKRLRYKENTTKYRNFSRNPRSHARILIYRPWRVDRAISLLRINYFNHMSWLPARPSLFSYKENNQTKEKENIYCQEWDSNPRLHSETRTPAPIVCWEGI